MTVKGLIKKISIIVLCSFSNTMLFAQQKVYDITAYGAKAGLTGINTRPIQQAIDAAALAGGGKVYIPAGIYVTGPLVLKTGVEFNLDENALLLGSSKRLDYTHNDTALISARGQHNISITGKGIIDGQGRELVENVLTLLRQGLIKDSEWLLKRPTGNNRPTILFFYGCDNVSIKDITLKNSASWVQNYSKCNNLYIDRIKVESTAYWNNDGIDLVDSKNVKVTNSFINAADDGICLKSEDKHDLCENIYVADDTIRSSACGFKLGTGSSGGFKHISARNLVVYDTYRSAIALESVDGATLEDIDIRNLVAKNTGNAIFLRLGHRNKDERYSSLKHVYIAGVKAEIPAGKPDIGYPVEGPPPKVPPHNLLPAIIIGIPGHPIENVTLENIEITYSGKANRNIAFINTDSLNTVTENIAGYPEFSMFGELPAWGLYVRHANNIKVKNMRLNFSAFDFRPAMIFDDVNTIVIDSLHLPIDVVHPAIILNKVSNPELKHLDTSTGNKNEVKIQ